jgi:hypothetical protein
MALRAKKPIFQSGLEVKPKQLEEICETVEMFSNLSRLELVATIAEHLGWVTASGQLKLDASEKLLEKMQGKGLILLPEKKETAKYKKRLIQMTERTAPPSKAIVGSVKDVGPVELQVVADPKTKALWKEYIHRYHYLGYKKPFGCYMRYFIRCDRGILGCVLFSGPSRSIGARDKWIGWTPEQRLRNQGWIVNNNRFLILPWVRVNNLASHALAKIARRIQRDWEVSWGYRPVLMETFVEPTLYDGTCYRAANWAYLGLTTGAGNVRPGKQYKTSPKLIFLYPLQRNFREVLTSDDLKGKSPDEW